ncbi:hypothetical protein NDU88_007323 [Pleurodeles waltl]|uniref:Uncharacterized protein n=1 Tax=Pleurodeles waltl TaxID=8319 RepID=A0AAV7PNN4_PLEWA|nr:hypothetical protein NDU88_007323 [Pleurodeles waltl]
MNQAAYRIGPREKTPGVCGLRPVLQRRGVWRQRRPRVRGLGGLGLPGGPAGQVKRSILLTGGAAETVRVPAACGRHMGDRRPGQSWSQAHGASSE